MMSADVRMGRSHERAGLLSALFLAAGFYASACIETRHSIGDDCLKDGDCISGICTQLHCTATPATTDSRATLVEAGGDVDTDGPAETTSGEVAIEPAEAASGATEESSMDVVTDTQDTHD